jgi:hypothetical protein
MVSNFTCGCSLRNKPVPSLATVWPCMTPPVVHSYVGYTLHQDLTGLYNFSNENVLRAKLEIAVPCGG